MHPAHDASHPWPAASGAGHEERRVGCRGAPGSASRAGILARANRSPEGRRGSYRFLVRNSWRCAVHGEAPRSPGAQLPCQPQTQVMVWSRWTYVSMTCFSGTSSTGTAERSGEAGGRPFTRISWQRNPHGGRRGPRIMPDLADSCTGTNSVCRASALYEPAVDHVIDLDRLCDERGFGREVDQV